MDSTTIYATDCKLVRYYPKNSNFFAKYQTFDNKEDFEKFVDAKTKAGFICDSFTFDSRYETQTTIKQTKGT